MSMQKYSQDNALAIAATFARPANTTAYTAGDIVSDSASATTLMQFKNAGRVNGAGGYITQIRLDTDKKDYAAQLRLHLFTKSQASVTIVGDNVQRKQLYANAPYSLGYIDLNTTATGADSSGSTGATSTTDLVPRRYLCDAADSTLYGVLEDRSGATPASAQNFRVTLLVDRD